MTIMKTTFGIADFCAFIVLICCVETRQYRSRGYLKDPWILPKSVQVTSDPDRCNVTVTFNSTGPVSVRWTTNDGFSPTDLSKQTVVSNESHGTFMATKVSIPFQLQLEMLKLHLISAEHAYEIHLGFDVYHGIQNTYTDINPYTLFVPPNTDIGISSRGQTQFHVFTNTSGTPFIFGMLQAEVTSLVKNQSDHVEHDVAYSFLPDNKSGKIRLARRIDSGSEYHTDIALSAPKVYTNGGIISITAACSAQNSIIRRLDTKQLLYLKSNPGKIPVAKNSLSFITMSSSDNSIHVDEFENALIRCKAVGNPAPKITLFRVAGEVIEPYVVPSYSSSHAYETLTVFQFINVTRNETGTYICRASVANKSKDEEHLLNVSLKLGRRHRKRSIRTKLAV